VDREHAWGGQYFLLLHSSLTSSGSDVGIRHPCKSRMPVDQLSDALPHTAAANRVVDAERCFRYETMAFHSAIPAVVGECVA
jgi:hypothetical protein